MSTEVAERYDTQGDEVRLSCGQAPPRELVVSRKGAFGFLEVSRLPLVLSLGLNPVLRLMSLCLVI